MAATAEPRFDPAVLEAAADARLVLSGTDDGRDAGIAYERAAAVALAARVGARLLLFDRAGEIRGDPPPAEGPFGRAELERRDKPYLVAQLDAAAAAGVEAVAWLPSLPTFESWAECIEACSPDFVVVPDRLHHESLADRFPIGHHWIERARGASGDLPMAVAYEDGRVEMGPLLAVGG